MTLAVNDMEHAKTKTFLTDLGFPNPKQIKH